jgi:hypothetical protein
LRDQLPPGSWVDERKQGVELRVSCLETEPQTMRAMLFCDAGRGIIDRDLSGAIEELIGDREPVNGIGRQAWVWFTEADEFLDVKSPAAWEAEAELAGNISVTVKGLAPVGRDAATQVLRAAVERIERRGRLSQRYASTPCRPPPPAGREPSRLKAAVLSKPHTIGDPRRNAVLVVLLLVLPACYMARASESYYGIDAAAGRNDAFVLDISGSMEGKQEGSVQDQIEGAAARHGASVVGGAVGGRAGRAVSRQIGGEATKLGAAKRELIPFINGLSEDAKFTLLVFGREVKAWQPELMPASRTNKQIAIGYLRNLSADGGTPALRALEQAFRVEDAT